MPVACIKLEDADTCLSLRRIIQLTTASTEINANMKLIIQLALFAVAFVHLTASTPVPETSIEGLSCSFNLPYAHRPTNQYTTA